MLFGRCLLASALCVLGFVAVAQAEPSVAPELLTVAEASGYRATATSAEVSQFLAALAERSELVHLMEIGRTNEDRPLEVAVIADPPIQTPEEARASGKMITLLYGNIHAGEVCGKEAILMLANEIAMTPNHPVLADHVLLLLPNYNADGNDRMSPDNRRNQVGPELGMGQRHNAQDLDLNRDWTKLDAPETRAMVGLLSDWDPHLTVDMHTTNGSHHRNALTFDGPTNPSTFAPLRTFVMEDLLPEVSKRLRERTGYATFFYGNFNREHTVWRSYSAEPRYSEPYMGLRHHLAILSEAHAYVDYETRVLVSREFLREILSYAGEHKEEVLRICVEARQDAVERGRRPQPDDVVAIRSRVAALPEPVVVEGYEMVADENGRPRPTETPKDHTVIRLGRFEAEVAVRRPFAYLLDTTCPPAVLEKLRQHGIAVEPFAGRARVEVYTTTGMQPAERVYQGHRLVDLEVQAEVRDLELGEGAHLVRTAQPLGTLAVFLLEPQAADGLARWNFFDEVIEEGATFPVYRVRSGLDLGE